MMRYGAKVEDGAVVEVLVLADGAKGDEAVAAFGLVEQDGVSPSVGWSWDGSAFAPPPVVVPAMTWEMVRAKRDRLLAASDWTQVVDAPVDQQAWAAYRQTLRDIPQDFDSPESVVWPERP